MWRVDARKINPPKKTMKANVQFKGVKMKAKNLFVVVIVSVMIASCASVPELDISSLDDKTFTLTEINMVVNAQVDPDWDGKDFLENQFDDVLVAVNVLFEKEGLLLDSEEYKRKFDSDSIKLIKDEIEFGKDFVLHEYTWMIEGEHSQYAVVSVPMVTREDGQIPAAVYLYKQNPEDAEQPFTTKLELLLQPKPKM